MLKPRKGLIGILAAFLGLVLLGGAGTLWMQNSTLTRMTEELRQKEEEKSQGERIARRQVEAEQQLEMDRARLEFLEAGVPNAAYVPTLLRDLEALAVNTHNRVSSVRPELVPVKAPTRLERRRDPNAADKPEGENGEKKEPEEKPKPYDPLYIKVSLVGTYPQIQAFLQQLTRFPKIVAVQELQLRPHAGAGKPEMANMLDCDLKLTAYIMKDSGRISVDAVTVPATPKPAAKEAL